MDDRSPPSRFASVLRRLTTPTAWVTAEKAAQQVLWAVLFAVLAPLLGPQPYGLFSLAMVVVGFCELVIVEAAAEALLTLPAFDEADVATANLCNLIAALVAAAITAALGAPVAAAFHAPVLAQVFWALAPLPVLSAFVSSPTAMLKRDMRFQPFAIRSILGLAVGGAAGVAAALTGAGVWALVIQALVQRAAEVATLAGAAPGALRLGFDRRRFDALKACAANVFVARGMMWAAAQAPRVIVGAALGPTALDLFTLANRITDVLLQVVLGPPVMVARLELRRFADAREGLDRAFAAMLRRTALVSFPLAVGLASVAPTLFAVWLGPRWAGAEVATQLTVLTVPVWLFFYYTTAASMGLRRPHLDTLIQTLLGVAAAAVTLAAAPFGLTAVCAALLLRLVVMLVLPLAMLSRAGGLKPLAVLGAPAGFAVAAAGMGGAVLAATPPLVSAIGRAAALPLLVALGAVVYAGLALALAPQDLRLTLRRFGRAAVAG